MAHQQQFNYIQKLKLLYPTHFFNVNVLEVGSLNINGSIRMFFSHCQYLGIDVGPGRDVDLVCEGQSLDHPDNTYDTVGSCECFEHNPFYKETIQNSYRMLKPGGMFLFTCATTGRPVHGTKTSDEINKLKHKKWITMPNVFVSGWDNEYYKNLTEEDIRKCADFDALFSKYEFSVENNHHDLYFWGVKK